jgi:Domain of unknown function (DUF4180)
VTTESLADIHGVRVLVVADDGPQLQDDRDVVDLIAKAIEHSADLVLLPVQRLTDDFFRLRTRLAGEVAQKFVNYRLRLAIVGDISGHLAGSAALRDFVAETNRGRQIWFAATPQEVTDRLETESRAGS